MKWWKFDTILLYIHLKCIFSLAFNHLISSYDATGSTLWKFILFWAVGSVYVFLDYFNRPKWLRKYKVQPGTNEPVETKRLISVKTNISWIYDSLDKKLPQCRHLSKDERKTCLEHYDIFWNKIISDDISLLRTIIVWFQASKWL